MYKTISFIVSLCFVVAVVLTFVSQTLKNKQNEAKSNYLDKQLLICANIDYPSESVIKSIVKKRLLPRLCDEQGNSYTFEELNIDYNKYIKANSKNGFHNLKYKLFYEIINPNKGYIIPINGYGLWDAIYGFLAIEKDCTTIIGVSWYDHKETPGLGGEIEKKWWQNQFCGKKIFSSQTPEELKIKVVKAGNYEQLPKLQQENAVDGISGATLTSTGVTIALRDSLNPYKEFLKRCAK